MTTMKARQDMRTKMLRAAMTLAVMLMATVSAWAKTPTQYISEVMLIGKNKKSEAQALRDQYVAQGWTAIDQDLNAGCGSGTDYIYLLYKQRSTASPNHTFITKFLISDASGDAPDSRTVDGRTYKLVPYDGDSHFKEKKGDLNSNAGGKDIHLYYTTERMTDKKAVTQILFNATKGGSVQEYDLNKGAGGDDIYMHCERYKAPQWVITKNSDGVRCIVNGFISEEGATKSDIFAFPAIIDGLVVVGIDKNMNFSNFKDYLETIYFSQAYNASTIPLAYECQNLKHVHIVDNNGAVVKANELPASITSIDDHTFRQTAIETLKMPNVSIIGKQAFAICYLNSVDIPAVTNIDNEAFSDCQKLSSIKFPSILTNIGSQAFYECTALSSISIPSSVTNIGSEAFMFCDALTSVTINGNPTIGVNAFFPDEAELKLKLTPNTAADGTKWLTFYNDYCNFKHDVSTKVYKATVDGGKVCLNELDKTKVNVVLDDGTTAESQASIVNAGTAVVLKTAMNRIEMYRTTDESDDTHPNDLHGVNARTYIFDMLAPEYKDDYKDCTFYVLTDKDGVGFYRLSGDRMPQNKAFLALKSSAGAREFYPVAENGTSTSMEDVRWEKEDVRGKMEDVDGAWYSIDGRRLSGKPTQKGVYIYQGRKEVIR